jgi:glucose-6-phosphate 1-dehydrogenase
VLQNHLLQFLTLIAMEQLAVLPPLEDDKEEQSSRVTTATADKIRDAKVAVLKCMPAITSQDCLMGQYDGYSNDATIANKATSTPTYACVRTWVNNATWSGVPFLLEAGKALDEGLCEARLYLHHDLLL